MTIFLISIQLLLSSCDALTLVQGGGAIAGGKTEGFSLSDELEFKQPTRDVKGLVLEVGEELGLQIHAEGLDHLTFETETTSEAAKFFISKQGWLILGVSFGDAQSKLFLTASAGGNYKQGTRDKAKALLDEFKTRFLEKTQS